MLQFLSSAALGWTLVVVVEPLIGITVDLWLRSIVALVIAVLYTLLLHWVRDPGTVRHQIPKNSKKFVDFYADWYKRDGHVHMYCQDLHWLQGPEYASIVEQLRLKGPQAHIYLRDLSGTVVSGLQDHGVQVFEVPPSVKIAVKFSLLTEDDHRVLIIRSKVKRSGMRRKTDHEEVLETQDSYLIDLASEFLSSLSAS
ncbi:hypothetical protein [Microbacterium sp. NPDC077184]|uniref:hypothetical protein n=1 Tax=Microbacterium sp. NPDC077184 TaxID=3154764 RepID=UPI0034275E61